MVKNLPATWETWVRSLGWEDHLEKGTATNSVLWPGEFLGQRSLAGYSPWGHKELDMTQQLNTQARLKVKVLVVQLGPTLCNPMDCSFSGSSVHGIFSDKDTRVGSHSLPQGIFPTQGSNPGLPHCRQIL